MSASNVARIFLTQKANSRQNTCLRKFSSCAVLAFIFLIQSSSTSLTPALAIVSNMCRRPACVTGKHALRETLPPLFGFRVTNMASAILKVAGWLVFVIFHSKAQFAILFCVHFCQNDLCLIC